jgi:hypothetical protein
LKKDHPYIQVGLLCLMLFSFFAKNLADIPWITPILAPDYAASLTALSTLNKTGSLSPSDKGANVLFYLFVDWFKENGKSQLLVPMPDDLRVNGFTTGGGISSGDEVVISKTILVAVTSETIHGSGTVHCDISVLTKLSDQLKNTEAFRWSAVLFLVSFFTEILFLVPKFREHKRKPDADEDYAGRAD